MIKEFLVQFKLDGEVVQSLMKPNALIKFLDMLDCTDVTEYRIFFSPEFGVMREARYSGWQMYNTIAVTDTVTGEIVAYGHGTDH